MSAQSQPMRIYRWPEFDGLKAGDKVSVVSGRSADRLKRRRLEFAGIAENVMTGARWLEAWHGAHMEFFKIGELKS